ncbi:hypothetical protein PM082_021978 [Marasmius tenuissimus]|nr:hypothetical protein PM082_021978 [Marasmius tenuissimus]
MALIVQNAYIVDHAIGAAGTSSSGSNRLDRGDAVTQALIGVFSNFVTEILLVSTHPRPSKVLPLTQAHVSLPQIHRLFTILVHERSLVSIPLVLMSSSVAIIGIVFALKLGANWNDSDSPFVFESRVMKSNVYDISSSISSTLITLSLAARVWWIRYRAEETMRRRWPGATRTTLIAVLLESGAIYPIIKVLTIVYNRVIIRLYSIERIVLPQFLGIKPGDWIDDSYASQSRLLVKLTTVPVQVSAIATMLLIRRVARGKSTESKKQVIRDTPASLDLDAPEVMEEGESAITPFPFDVPSRAIPILPPKVRPREMARI